MKQLFVLPRKWRDGAVKPNPLPKRLQKVWAFVPPLAVFDAQFRDAVLGAVAPKRLRARRGVLVAYAERRAVALPFAERARAVHKDGLVKPFTRARVGKPFATRPPNPLIQSVPKSDGNPTFADKIVTPAVPIRRTFAIRRPSRRVATY